MFHLTSLFNAVEISVHLELLNRADGFELLIGRPKDQKAGEQMQFHAWLTRNAIVYHVDDPVHLPIIAEDQCDFDRTPGIFQPLQTIEHSLLQVNRSLMRAVSMAVKSCRCGRRPDVSPYTMEVTQDLLQTAIKVRARGLAQYPDVTIEPPQKDINLQRLT